MSELSAAKPAPVRLRSLPSERPQPDTVASEARWKLPRPLTSLIGREADIATVCDLLLESGVRLLTLTGPGGVGKTRLALRVAEDAAAAFPDGVAFVPLAAISDPDLVLPTIARVLGLREVRAQSSLDALIDALRPRRLLLVLDNFEQVRTAATHLATLLSACPELVLLITSRVLLHISGEQRFPVASLALPVDESGGGRRRAEGHESQAARRQVVETVRRDIAASPAVQLFVARAQAVDPAFALAAENAAAVTAICRRLDGLPLALELAAARVRLFSPDALLVRLAPALPLLTEGPEDVPNRLRTMRDAIAWSYALLSPAELTMFQRLAVFVGGFTLEAAEVVGAAGGAESNLAVLSVVTALVDKSLLQHISGPHGQARYAMLETVREFALEALATTGEETPPSGGDSSPQWGEAREGAGLGGEKAAHNALAEWCVAFAERAEPELAGPDAAAWVTRIEAELGNIRAAHAWLRQRGDAEKALRLAGALGWFWSSGSNFHEGRNVFDQVLAMPGATEAPAALAKVLHSAGDVEQWLGNLDRAREHFEQALAIFNDLDDRRGVVAMLRGLGSVAIDRGDLAGADALLREVLTVAPEAGAAWEAASAANLLAVMAYTRGDYAGAIRFGEEAVAGWQDLGDTAHVGTASANLSRAALASGDLTRAATLIRVALAHVPADGDDTLFCDCFEIAAGFAEMARQRPRAVRLLAASDAMQQRMGSTRWPVFQDLFEQSVRVTRQAVGESRFATAWGAGQVMHLHEATAEALAALPPVAGVSPPSAVAGDDEKAIARFAELALTPREREILRLLVEGHSDREIAAACGISHHTVSQHVATIRGKLDAPSRTAAASMAVRDGLVEP